MPPFSGFWAKFYVFGAAIDGGLLDGRPRPVWSASVVAAFYYLRIIKLMWFDPAPGEASSATDRSPVERQGHRRLRPAAAFSFPLVHASPWPGSSP